LKLLFAILLAACALDAETFTYWIEPCTRPEAECEPADERLAEWALQAWQRASDSELTFVKSPLSKARIRLYWALNGNQGLYGEARPIMVDGKPGAEVAVRPALHALGHKVEGAGNHDKLYRHTIVYLTCLHETGHALGLQHSKSFNDIMYSFEYGGNILEYFARYRRKLKTIEDMKSTSGISPEDEKRLRLLYPATRSSVSLPSSAAATERQISS
jgi:hypothetical protein